ncbi:hypothetical protein Leryth_023728 [Lithospermum erythrorhizon]|nr:hypothetical protein Leryth_023728 [Lithospermum erythrorhizon]
MQRAIAQTQKVGRPEACVLFAQTFVHPELDEYVDEVLFAEPVVVTACEFIEQNASSTCAAVKLNGATSPPSFALEVFVQCEGETRFRRICQPFLYSHSSSSILEVEAIVTNHLVVRGSYRSLSLVIYGNTAEDLGQFNIEVGLDSSLTNTVSTIDGDLEDLPLALRSTSLTIEEFEHPLETLALVNVTPDLAVEVKQFLQVLIKILDLPELKDAQGSVLNCVLSVASIYANPNTTSQKDLDVDKLNNVDVLIEASRELLCLHEKQIQHQQGEPPTDILADSTSLESGIDFMSTKKLVDTLIPYFEFGNTSGNDSHLQASKTQNLILLLGIAILLCHTKESCFHFVNGGGMELLEYALTSDSAALKLMALADIEQATRHSVGCEGFLGWWPREKDNIPSSVSERYCKMLKLVLQNQRHDIVSLATYILHRVRVYEVASRYENAILSILGNLSAARQGSSTTLDMLADAKLQLMKLSKLINLRGPIDNPSPVASATESLVLDDAGFLSYKATRGLINKCDLGYWNQDVDSHLLSLLKERGFLPLSAALLSSSLLRSESGPALDLFVDIVSHIEAIILSLLFSRSGLVFLLHEPELASTVIRALMGSEISRKVEYPSLRYASVLISKGFFFNPQDVAKIVEMHLKMIYAIDRLTSSPNNEEFLWLLWDLCRLSRSNCGRQALLSLIHFPEALSVLMAALHSTTELDPISTTNGDPTLNLAIFHAAAEIFEVIVTDSTTSSLGSWIDHAKELHRALHSSSPGSNKKDAPARLLEWIDAGVVYHRNGALGLLRYAAVLASGGDAHMASTSMLASDTVDVDNVVGDSSNSSDGNIIDNLLGKRITEKDFPGVILRDSSIVQLTTAFRILAFISDTSNVAAALYDEGAIMVIHAVLINCRLMLERSSNIYDYLVGREMAREQFNFRLASGT